MIRTGYYIILLTFFSVFFTGCDVQREKADYLFILQTINGKNIQEYGSKGFPLEIELMDYEPGKDIFKGRVKLVILGWEAVDDTDTEHNCFRVNTKGEMGPVEYLLLAFAPCILLIKNDNGNFFAARAMGE